MKVMGLRCLAVVLMVVMAPVPGGAQKAAPTTAADGPQPAIEIPAMTHNLGEIYHQDKYAHTFTVRNRGHADLLIDDVKPSCGCTAARFDKVISPGHQGKIELEIDGNKVHGEFAKVATVHSNDPEHPQTTLTLAGKVIAFVSVVPDGALYLHGRYGEAIVKELAITSNEKDLDFKITGVRSNIDDKITYALENGTGPGEYTLKVYKNPKLPTFSTYGTIFLESNSTRSPETPVQVHVMTKGSITPTPPTLNYGPVKFTDQNGKGTPATRTVTLTRTSGEFNIKDVTVNNSNFEAEIEPVPGGQQYRIQVTFTPPARKQAQQTELGELLIHTDDPQEPAVRVQLIARSQ